MPDLLPLTPGSISALLIVDMQTHFFRLPARRVGLEAATANINRLSTLFDQRGWPVVHVFSAYRANGSDWDLRMKASGKPELIEGSPEAAILAAVNVLPAHWQVRKTRYSGFFKTGLAERLHQAGVGRVMVCGAYTHYCVNATVLDAYAYDFVPGLVSDAALSHLPEISGALIGRMVRNGYHVLTTAELVADLTRAGAVVSPGG